MNKRQITIRNVIYTVLVSMILGSCSVKPEQKPNIVFIFADDQCYDAIHALGYNSEIITPNLDKLADKGTTFTHAYNMGAWQPAVCLASRAMLNTGRYVWDAARFDNLASQDSLAQKGEMWSQLMKKAGYETYMTGKWHLKIKADSVFDHVVHERPGMPQDEFLKNYSSLVKKLKEEYKRSGDISELLPNGYSRPASEADTSWMPWDKSNGGFWEGGTHWSEVLGNDAIGFINRAKEKETPFFMYLAFNAPHDPRQSPKEFVDMYPLEKIEVPESFIPEYPYKDAIGCSPVLRDEALAPFPRTEYSIKVNRQEYYAIITHMDVQIGRILDALETSGKADNTYIFFTADHGLAVGNHGLAGKQNMYDHSIRPPLLVAGPGIPEGGRISAAVYLQDIMASSLEIAGVQKPEYVRFNSFMPLIRGERTESLYPAIYGCYTDEQRMIRNENFKLIIYPKIKKLRLYDIQNDPLELVDLIDKNEYASIVSDLLKDFQKLQVEYEDNVKLDKIYNDYIIQ